MLKYLIGLIVAIVVIIFIIIKLLTGGSGSPQQAINLASYANTGTIMRFTSVNATQASQNHQTVQIDVGENTATLTVFRGYEGNVVRSKSYPMNEAAYRDFLRGLQLSGDYTDGDSNPAFQDQSGYCATGTHYIYEIIDGSGNVIQHFWSTNCGVKTFKGNEGVVQQLFNSQIPDLGDLTSDVNL
jgi:type II secretory pathway pseudopilin PulG